MHSTRSGDAVTSTRATRRGKRSQTCGLRNPTPSNEANCSPTSKSPSIQTSRQQRTTSKNASEHSSASTSSKTRASLTIALKANQYGSTTDLRSPQAMLDKLSRPRRGAAAALSVYDMGNGDTAFRVLARNLDECTCMCCPNNRELSIGVDSTNVQRYLTSRVHCHWASYRQQVHGQFMAWALMRLSPGVHLRSECPNLPTCSHEKQPCRGHSLIGMAV